MATAKKTPAEKATIVEHDIPEETSPAEQEVAQTGPMEFTITIDGEEITLQDHYKRADKLPPFSLIGNGRGFMKYSTLILEQIIGEDQIAMLMEKGIDQEEFATIVGAWAQGRGLGEG